VTNATRRVTSPESVSPLHPNNVHSNNPEVEVADVVADAVADEAEEEEADTVCTRSTMTTPQTTKIFTCLPSEKADINSTRYNAEIRNSTFSSIQVAN
jgi:hypothetical protein